MFLDLACPALSSGRQRQYVNLQGKDVDDLCQVTPRSASILPYRVSSRQRYPRRPRQRRPAIVVRKPLTVSMTPVVRLDRPADVQNHDRTDGNINGDRLANKRRRFRADSRQPCRNVEQGERTLNARLLRTLSRFVRRCSICRCRAKSSGPALELSVERRARRSRLGDELRRGSRSAVDFSRPSVRRGPLPVHRFGIEIGTIASG